MRLPALPHTLPVRTLPRGERLWRVHDRDRAALWFGPAPGDPPGHRFDAPGGEYRVCYLGDSAEVAFAETLIRGASFRVVRRSELERRCASPVPLGRDLRLAELHGRGLVRLGIGAEVVHGHPYYLCRMLAYSLWSHTDGVDGIEYRSRWDNDRLCVALFDRAADALGTPEPPLLLDDLGVVRPILRYYGVGVV